MRPPKRYDPCTGRAHAHPHCLGLLSTYRCAKGMGIPLSSATAAHWRHSRARELRARVYYHNIHNMVDLAKITSFEWDEGNCRKNEKHGVSMADAEQLFFNTPLLLLEDSRHSSQESRFHALGRSDDGRHLHITFTLRGAGEKIRVISARDMHRKERAVYEKAT